MLLDMSVVFACRNLRFLDTENMTWETTLSVFLLVAKLSADDGCILIRPSIITNCAPLAIDKNLHTSFLLILTIHQPDGRTWKQITAVSSQQQKQELVPFSYFHYIQYNRSLSSTSLIPVLKVLIFFLAGRRKQCAQIIRQILNTTVLYSREFIWFHHSVQICDIVQKLTTILNKKVENIWDTFDTISLQAGHVFLTETLWVNLTISQSIKPFSNWLLLLLLTTVSAKTVQHCVKLQLILITMHIVLQHVILDSFSSNLNWLFIQIHS